MGLLDVGINFNSLGETSGVIHVDHHINDWGRQGFENRIRARISDLYLIRYTCSLGIYWRVEGQRIRIMVSDSSTRDLDFAWGIQHILEAHKTGNGSRKSKGHSLGAVGCLSDVEVCLKWLRVDYDFNS